MSTAASLENEIVELRDLDKLRATARSLRDQGMSGLNPANYSPAYVRAEPGEWSSPGDAVERALLVAVKPDFPAKSLLKLTLEDLFESMDFWTEKLDHVPVLKAATALEAMCTRPGDVVSPAAAFCYFRIIYALNAASHDEIRGGASSGAPEAPQTAFITWRCARALVALREVLTVTRQYLDIVSESQRTALAQPKAWVQLQQRITQKRHQVEIDRIRGRILIEVGDASKLSLKAGRRDVERAMAQLDKHLDATRGEVGALKKPVHWSESAESAASEAIQRLRDALQKKSLESAVSTISDQLATMRVFVRSVLDHELVSAQEQSQRVPDAAELIFAAATLSDIGAAEHGDLQSALREASRLMTNDGRVPSHKPFDVAKKGYVLHVAGAEVLDAFSNLAATESYPVTVDTAQRVLSHFVGTFKPGDQPGWRHERDKSSGLRLWWLSALSVQSLGSYIKMLDLRINQLVMSHLSTRSSSELKLPLSALFVSDYGFVAGGVKRQSVIESFLELQGHVCGTEIGGLHTAILHGPPGTGKTTFVEALARSSDAPLIEITPSDILLGGEAEIETRARTLFEALAMVTGAVILFDEFDRILWDRSQAGATDSIFQFLTPGMLPKLKALNEHAKRNRVVFVLSTNLIGGLDGAAIREGRFDKYIGIFPPDTLSRAGRLEQVILDSALSKADAARKETVIKKTAGVGMTSLARPGWFVKTKSPKSGTALHFVRDGGEPPAWPVPEKELPQTPTADYHSSNEDAVFPNEHAISEWQEWLFLAITDRMEVEKASDPGTLKGVWDDVTKEKTDGSSKAAEIVARIADKYAK